MEPIREVKICRLEEGRRVNIMISYIAGKGLRAFRNGREIEVQQITGDFSKWREYDFVLGNESEDDREWTGMIYDFSISSTGEMQVVTPRTHQGQPQGDGRQPWRRPGGNSRPQR